MHWSIRRAIVCVACTALLTMTSGGYAGDKRECTTEEEMGADNQLTTIAEDDEKSKELIEQHLPFGQHISRHTAQGKPTNEQLLVQGGYVIFHDGDLRTALWTAHRLTRTDVIGGECKKRVECFRADKRLPENQAAREEDYDEPIFDQGHMTSDRDLRDDLTEQVNSYVMSNMSPQYAGFNRGIWGKLEKLGRVWAKKYKTIYVTSGALFDFNRKDARDKDDAAARVGTRSQTARVAIPSHYYKVFLRSVGERWSTIAFLLNHDNSTGSGGRKTMRQRLEDAIKSLAWIEKRSELIFHPDLDRSHVDESLNGIGWDFTNRRDKDESECES